MHRVIYFCDCWLQSSPTASKENTASRRLESRISLLCLILEEVESTVSIGSREREQSRWTLPTFLSQHDGRPPWTGSLHNAVVNRTRSKWLQCGILTSRWCSTSTWQHGPLDVHVVVVRRRRRHSEPSPARQESSRVGVGKS